MSPGWKKTNHPTVCRFRFGTIVSNWRHLRKFAVYLLTTCAFSWFLNDLWRQLKTLNQLHPKWTWNPNMDLYLWFRWFPFSCRGGWWLPESVGLKCFINFLAWQEFRTHFLNCNQLILLMVQKSGVHQLSLVAYPIIYKVLAPSQVVIAGFLNHQQYGHDSSIFKMVLVFGNFRSITLTGLPWFLQGHSAIPRRWCSSRWDVEKSHHARPVETASLQPLVFSFQMPQFTEEAQGRFTVMDWEIA